MVMAETRQIAVPPIPSLLAAARAGDSHAIEQLLLPHEPALRSEDSGSEAGVEAMQLLQGGGQEGVGEVLEDAGDHSLRFIALR